MSWTGPSNTVTRLDPNSGAQSGAVAVGGSPAHLAISADGHRLYVANVGSNDLAVIDTARLQSIAHVAVGAMPYGGVAATPDGASILVTSQHQGALSIIDAHSLPVVGAIPIGRYPEGVLAGPFGLAYVANGFSGDVSVVDLARRREAFRIKVGERPRSFALMPERP